MEKNFWNKERNKEKNKEVKGKVKKGNKNNQTCKSRKKCKRK